MYLYIHNHILQLHPSYRGELLTEEQKNLVEEYFLQNLDGEGLTSLQKFYYNEDIFSILNDRNIHDPIIYWRLAERKHPVLSKLAIRLINIPASSAQLERLFSNWHYIHSDLRNRLKPDKSKKLVHTYYSLKMNDIEIED